MLNKSNALRHMANVSENRKKQFLLHFDPVFRVDVLINGVEDAPF